MKYRETKDKHQDEEATGDQLESLADELREDFDVPMLIDALQPNINDVMSWDAERGFLIAAFQKAGHDDSAILKVLRELEKIYKQKPPQFGYATYYAFLERTEIPQSLDEARVPIKGYEGLYEITASGRVFSTARNRYRERAGNEYGFKWVKLTKNGESKNFLTKVLWREAFECLPESDYRGEQ